MFFQKTKHKTKSMIDFPSFSLSLHRSQFFKTLFKNNIIKLTMRQQNFEYTEGVFHSDKMKGQKQIRENFVLNIIWNRNNKSNSDEWQGNETLFM